MRSPEHAVEKIWGPINGLYVAAYAAPVDDDRRRFASYAKVCWRAPGGYWDAAECLFKLFGGEHHGSAESALTQVRRVALGKVACVPRAAVSMLDIASRQDSQRLLVPLASAIRWRVLRGA
jgi:hypothetical protein